jgi:hypothetical protein
MPLDELTALAAPVRTSPAAAVVATVSVPERPVAKPIDSRTRRTEINLPSAPVPIAAVSRLAPLPAPSPPAPAIAPSGVVSEPARVVPPASTSTAPPAPPVEILDTRAIQQALGQYRNAFNVLDSAAAKAIWPAVDERALSRAFDRLRQQSFYFTECNIAISGDRATASCSGTASYTPKVGSRTPHSESRQWWFNLRKVNEAWVIDQVDTR